MWSEVFLTQARSDWQLYEHLDETSYPSCHASHYLQMATEKLAKAYLLAGRSKYESVVSTHKGFTRFLQLTYRSRGLQEEMGMMAKQLHALVAQILPLAHEIESLAPSLACGGANAEYPWESPTGVHHAPAEYDWRIYRALHESHGRNLLKIIRVSLNKFYVLHGN